MTCSLCTWAITFIPARQEKNVQHLAPARKPEKQQRSVALWETTVNTVENNSPLCLLWFINSPLCLLWFLRVLQTSPFWLPGRFKRFLHKSGKPSALLEQHYVHNYASTMQKKTSVTLFYSDIFSPCFQHKSLSSWEFVLLLHVYMLEILS